MKQLAFSLLILCAVAQSSMAAFYVDDDAPNTVAMRSPVQSPSTAYERAAPLPIAQPVESTAVDIPFMANSSAVTPRARTMLQNAFGDMENADEISVTAYATRPSNVAMQKQRTQVLRSWMTENGLPTSKIMLVESEERGNPNTLKVTMATRAKSARSSPSAQPAASRFANARLVSASEESVIPAGRAPAYPSTSAAPLVTSAADQVKPLFNDQVKLDLIVRIVRMAQNKIVKPEDAVNMLADILNNQETAAPAGSPAQVQQIHQVMTVEMPRSWTLDSSKTLQENVTEWAVAAKWEKPNWLPTAPYRVAYNSTLNGTFVEVLRQVAEVVPSLDFEANKVKRTLTVIESPKK